MRDGGSIRISGREAAIPAGPGQTILEACLDAGLPMSYNCRSGECAECRATLVAGAVDEAPGADPAVFSDADRQAGRILTCLCSPAGDVEIDLVLRDGVAAPRIERVNALVERIEPVSASVWRVTLETPWPLDYRPGQYFDWVVPGIEPNRSFSAANAPGGERIDFDVRIYPDGAIGRFLERGTGLGHAIELVGPFGRFGLSGNDFRPAIMVAGSTGLAPLKAMLDAAARRRDPRPITLFWGVRGRADLYDLALLDRWTTALERLDCRIVLSEEPDGAGWTGARGLVTDALAAALDGPLGADAFGAEAYLCGPPPMIDAALPILERAGVASEDIRFDRFLPARGRR